MDVLPVELWLGVAEYQAWPQHTALELLDDELAAEFRAWYPGPAPPIVINGPDVPAKHKRAIIARYPSLQYWAIVHAESAEADILDTRGAQYVGFSMQTASTLHIHGPNHYTLSLAAPPPTGEQDAARVYHAHMPPSVKEVVLDGGRYPTVTCADDVTGHITTLTVPPRRQGAVSPHETDLVRVAETIVYRHPDGPPDDKYHVSSDTHEIFDSPITEPREDLLLLLQRGRVASYSTSSVKESHAHHMRDAHGYLREAHHMRAQHHISIGKPMRGLDLLRGVSVVTLSGVIGLKGHSMAFLGGACHVDLSGSDVVDVSALGAVPVLHLRGCLNITDVSALGACRELDLSGCVGVTKVSRLGGVRRLSLARTGVVDVSALGAVHWLDLSGCAEISDFSALGRHYHLDLSETHVTCVANLRFVYTLVLKDLRESRADLMDCSGRHRCLIADGYIYRGSCASGAY